MTERHQAGTGPDGYWVRDEFLSRTEERELFVDYKKGVVARAQIDKGKLDHMLIIAVERGKQAEEKLIVAHLPLVRSMAKRFYQKHRQDVEFDDLVGVGNETLVRTLRRYSPDRGARFSTCAWWWIMNKMNLFIRSGRWVMKIPERTYRAATNLTKVTSLMHRELRRFPAIDELASRMGLSVERVRQLLVWIPRRDVSLDMPIGEDGKSTLGDMIRSDQRPWVSGESDSSGNDALGDAIWQVLQMLSLKEQKVLATRFGLLLGSEGVPERLRGKLAISKMRARELEARALRKLRHTRRVQLLEEILAVTLRGSLQKTPNSDEAGA